MLTLKANLVLINIMNGGNRNYYWIPANLTIFEIHGTFVFRKKNPQRMHVYVNHAYKSYIKYSPRQSIFRYKDYPSREQWIRVPVHLTSFLSSNQIVCSVDKSIDLKLWQTSRCVSESWQKESNRILLTLVILIN